MRGATTCLVATAGLLLAVGGVAADAPPPGACLWSGPRVPCSEPSRAPPAQRCQLDPGQTLWQPSRTADRTFKSYPSRTLACRLASGPAGPLPDPARLRGRGVLLGAAPVQWGACGRPAGGAFCTGPALVSPRAARPLPWMRCASHASVSFQALGSLQRLTVHPPHHLAQHRCFSRNNDPSSYSVVDTAPAGAAPHSTDFAALLRQVSLVCTCAGLIAGLLAGRVLRNGQARPRMMG